MTIMNFKIKIFKNHICYLVIILFAFSCNKNVEKTINDTFKSDINLELKSKMSQEQFSDLNLEKLSISDKVGLIQIAQIPFKSDSNSILYFAKNKDKFDINIVKHKNREVKNGKITETLNVTSINGVLIKTYKIVENKIIANSNNTNTIIKISNTDGSEPIIEGSGGDVIVTGFRSSDNSVLNFYNLYYFFTNPQYNNYYSCEFLEGASDYSNGNSENLMLAYLPFGKIFEIHNFIPIKIGNSKFFDFTDNKSFFFQNCNVQLKLDENNKLVSNTINANFTGFVAGTFTPNTNQNYNTAYFTDNSIYHEHQGIWGYQKATFKFSILILIKPFTDLDGIEKFNISIDYANR